MYKKIDKKIINKLAGIMPEENIYTDEGDLEKYAEDESPGLHYMPAVVLKPTETDRIKDILKLANKFKIPVTGRGGGTGLTGGALPVYGGIVISFELLDNIIDIDNKNRMAVVEPGVINGVFQKEVENEGLFYPVNPASMDSCTLGGNLANSTGGANTVRYGTTRNYITGLKAVTGEGNCWQSGGKIIKNSTDASIMHLLCGSEGTLSLFTELTFRLLNKPTFNSWIIAPFKDIYKIPEIAGKLFKAKLNPTMVELMDSETLRLSYEYLENEQKFKDCSYLLVRYDCDTQEEIEKHNLKTGEICYSAGAQEVLLAQKSRDQEKIWKLRSSLHDAIVNKANSVCEEDIVVPVDAVAELIKRAYRVSEKYGFRAVIFGHLGDGNMHINIISDNDKKNTDTKRKVDDLKDRLFKISADLGGKLSGEHGIGLTKKPYFEKYTDLGYTKLLKKIKKDFDPNNILNPGKLF
ncbi:MAG: FAD-binding oxidoreductase [Elusimicrobia bacterium]|nr:FAD-binding oxidoreductase [Elusimicrobiota bacterium]